MRNLLNVTLAFCLALSSTIVLAQSSVSGNVVDSETGTPLPGVNVVIQGTSTGNNEHWPAHAVCTPTVTCLQYIDINTPTTPLTATFLHAGLSKSM